MAQSCRKNCTSWACTPFLLHRLLLKCANASWWCVASNFQDICGPSSLCYCPFLRRFRFSTTVFKKGAIAHASSYRYIAVADLHDLLQEDGIALTPNWKFSAQLCWPCSDRVQVRCHASPIYPAYFAGWIPTLETCFYRFFCWFCSCFSESLESLDFSRGWCFCWH